MIITEKWLKHKKATMKKTEAKKEHKRKLMKIHSVHTNTLIHI